MEIMMFVVADPEIDGSEVDQEAVAEWDRVMAERGVLKRAMRLRPADEAKTVRVRGGEVIVTDGPFTESKEWIAGYDLLEVDRPRRGRGHRQGRPARPVRRARAPAGLAARDRGLTWSSCCSSPRIPRPSPTRNPAGSRSTSGSRR